MIKESWMLKNKNADLSKISHKYNISRFLSKILVNRGLISEEQIDRYINISYDVLHEPEDMKDIKLAVEIIREKIEQKKKIRIIGDYDVDGVISVFVLYKAFKRVGADIDYEIPDRIKDGYGINEKIIDAAYKDGVDTVITCDNGIAAIKQIEHAKKLGLTVIVTDHHDIPFIEEGGEKKFISSEADAIVNPKQIECNYKFKKLCGAAVAFKFIQCLYRKFKIDKAECYKLIEFVAIATVCDVVELIDENRFFVKKGLELLDSTENIGLRALIKANKLEEVKLTAYHLGFVIGPCINASGRLDSAKKGLELLLSEDEEKASKLAEEILELNVERKEMTKEGVDKAVEIIENTDLGKDKILVIYIKDVHESIVGIIAGRIKEKYNKPTIVLTKAEDGVKGSARSIEAYNMFEGLMECKEFLDKFGGHPMAAGLSLPEENVDALREMLNKNCKLKKEDLIKTIRLDLALDIDKINTSMVEELSILEPFGTGNPKPIFGVRNVKILRATKIGKHNNVLKLKLLSNYKTIDAIAFNNIDDIEELIVKKYGKRALSDIYSCIDANVYMDFTFYPSINEWNGSRSVQVIINSARVV